MGGVFLSYRRSFIGYILALRRRLDSLGLNVWFDYRMGAGTNVREQIYAQIDGSSCGIVAFSQSVFEPRYSGWVIEEASRLFDQEKLVPIQLEANCLKAPFLNINAPDLSRWFGQYGGCARLPYDSASITCGSANSPAWLPVLSSLESKLGRNCLKELDESFDEAAELFFGGDREIAQQRKFRFVLDENRPPDRAVFIDYRERLNIRIQEMANGDRTSFDLLSSFLRETDRVVSLLAPARPRPVSDAWPDGARRGDSLYGAFVAGDVFRDRDDSPRMVIIPDGNFSIGSPLTELGRSDDEGPQREIKIDRPFAVMETPVTVNMWREFLRDVRLPSPPKVSLWDPDVKMWRQSEPGTWDELYDQCDGDTAAFGSSWREARLFAEWVSARTGRQYRLPSEVEWEYASRSGETSAYPWGEVFSFNNARCRDNMLPSATNPGHVKQCEATRFGLFDTSGTIWEWCEDAWCDGYGALGNTREPRADLTQEFKVTRGGSWRSRPEELRCAARRRSHQETRDAQTGFRLVRDLGELSAHKM